MVPLSHEEASQQSLQSVNICDNTTTSDDRGAFNHFGAVDEILLHTQPQTLMALTVSQGSYHIIHPHHTKKEDLSFSFLS